LAPYDTDQKISVWGFGGKINGQVSHCFALNMNEDNPEVNGVEGIMSAYDEAFNTVTLSGPTLFSQVLSTASAIAASQEDQNAYSILLILTDGVINDMESTKKSIIQACHTPLSIIIIGVGDADFSQMEELDGDGGVLQIDGEKATRDIVQFVPMRQFDGVPQAHIAKETLAEVPPQFLHFMRIKGIRPNPKMVLQEEEDKEEDLPTYDDLVAAQSPQSNNSNASSPVLSSPPRGPKPLPANWIVQDDGQGTVWYFNTVTQETQWDRPQ